jgi:hypothetical protein
MTTTHQRPDTNQPADAYQAWTYYTFRRRIGGPATAPPDPDQAARQATTPEA